VSLNLYIKVSKNAELRSAGHYYVGWTTHLHWAIKIIMVEFQEGYRVR